MKKYLLLLFIAVSFVSCFFNQNIYKAADFDNKSAEIKTIAILPFNVTTIGYLPRYISEAEIQLNNEKLSHSFQESLYNYLVLYTGNKKKEPVKEFQSLQKTNALLKQNNISITDIYEKKPEGIAKLLGVDAVILTNIEEHKFWDEGTSYRGIHTEGNQNKNNSSDFAKINCYLYEGNLSGLLWQTYCNGDTKLMNDTVSLIEYFTNWVARHFPYRS